MSATKVAKKFRRLPSTTPAIFNCRLEEMLRAKYQGDYSVTRVALFLKVSKLTARGILAGGTVKLENALRLAELVGAPITDIWELRG